MFCEGSMILCDFERDVAYRAELVDPSSGQVYALGRIDADADGRWPLPTYPAFHDWVVIAEAESES